MKWQPEALPEGETEESQETIMNELKSVWEPGPRREAKPEVKSKMAKTYATQRQQINQKDCVLTDIIDNWPFLFEEPYLLDHFKELCEVDIMDKISSAFTDKVPKIYRYFDAQSKPKMDELIKEIQDETAKKEDENPKVMGLLLLLSEHFKEDLGEHVKVRKEQYAS